MDKPIKTFVVAFAFLVSGCTHLPDATVKYYLPKSSVAVSVVRTVGCNAKNNILIASAVTPTVTHSADRSEAGTQSISLSALRGAMSDSDVKVDFYDDGRLKGFNSSSTGQGEAVLKGAISVAGAALGFDGKPQSFPTECQAINTVGGGKPVALTYRLESVIFNEIKNEANETVFDATDQELTPDPASSVIIESNNLLPALGKICARVLGKRTLPTPRAKYEGVKGDVLLALREPALAEMEVVAGGAASCGDKPIWKELVPVAQLGIPYNLPIPRPAIFGKRALAATFAESGSMQSVQFVSATGAAQVLNSIGAAQAATRPETTAEKAAAVKAEADLIAQLQRLAACQATPTDCK